MGKHKVTIVPVWVLCSVLVVLLSDYVLANSDQHYMPPLECYDPFGRPQVRIFKING